MQYNTSLHVRLKEKKYKEKVNRLLEEYNIFGDWKFDKDFIADFELGISNDLFNKISNDLNNILGKNAIIFGTNTCLSTDENGYVIYSICGVIDKLLNKKLEKFQYIDIYNLDNCFEYVNYCKKINLEQKKFLKDFNILLINNDDENSDLLYEPCIRTVDAYDSDSFANVGDKLILEVSEEKDAIFVVDQNDNYYGNIMIDKIDENGHQIIDYDLEFIKYTDLLVAVVLTKYKKFMNGKGFDIAIINKKSPKLDELIKKTKLEKQDNKYENYVDIKYDSSNTSYTYISPKNRVLITGDKIKVRSYGTIKDVIVTKGTYKSKIKNDYEYKKLDILE